MVDFRAEVKKTYDRHYKVVPSTNVLMEVRKRYWEFGTATALLSTSNPECGNPLFMYSGAGGSRFSVNKDTSPLDGFPGSATLSPTTESHSSQATEDQRAISDDEIRRAVIWGMREWRIWCDAFKDRIVKERNSKKSSLRIRFYMGDPVHFCIGLHQRLYNYILHQFPGIQDPPTPPTDAVNSYSRPGTTQPLRIDGEDYQLGSRDPAPIGFNVIDTGYLVDSVGALTILPAIVHLIRVDKGQPVIYTTSRKSASKPNLLENMLCGNVGVTCTLLGIVPVEYLSGVTTTYHESTDNTIPVTNRITWREQSAGDTMINRSCILPKSSPKEFANFLFELYLRMFPHESIENSTSFEIGNGDADQPLYTKASFAALVVFCKRHIACRWDESMPILSDIIPDRMEKGHAFQGMQDLMMHLGLSGAFNDPVPDTTPLPTYSLGILKYKKAPMDAAVVLRVPRSKLQPIYNKVNSLGEPLAFSFQLYLQRKTGLTPHIFSSVQAIFGKLRPAQDGETGTIEEDSSGWDGTSDLYLCGYIPTVILRLWGDFPDIIVGARLLSQRKVVNALKNTLGPFLNVFNTCLKHHDSVWFFRSLPGLKKPSPKSPPALEKEVAFENDIYSAKFPRLGLNNATFTTKIDVIGKAGQILRDGATVTVSQQSPSTLTIAFSNVRIPCSFPFPVIEQDTKVRVSRKSGSLEVITPLVTNSNRGFFRSHPFPIVRQQFEPRIQSPFLPYIDFRKLQKFDISDKTAELQLHLNSMFSDAENATKSTTGQFDSLGCLKDSICRMLLSPSRVFRIRERIPGSAVFVFFIAGFHFDFNSQSIVVDAYVKCLPPVPGVHPSISALISPTPNEYWISDRDMNFWRSVLPALAERCRDWEHTPQCEYLGSERQEPLGSLCSCGHGKIAEDFPESWKRDASDVTRIAISPLFPLPYIESTQSPAPQTTEISNSVNENTDPAMDKKPRCRVCQKQPAKSCARCRDAAYCSRECQVKDWKEHKKHCRSESQT